MKFIETGDGSQINADKIKFFYADKSGRVFAVFDPIMRNDKVTGYFERLLFRFESQEAAKNWLDELVAKLDAEE